MSNEKTTEQSISEILAHGPVVNLTVIEIDNAFILNAHNRSLSFGNFFQLREAMKGILEVENEFTFGRKQKEAPAETKAEETPAEPVATPEPESVEPEKASETNSEEPAE